MALATKIASALRTLGGKKQPRVAAIIVAAGSSTRMGGTLSKQFMEVAGIPVLARTLLAFEATATVKEIVVVARESDLDTVRALADTWQIKKLTAVVAGGGTRALSVENGFAALGENYTHVAIHDGARCLITEEMIERVVSAAGEHRAATAAYPVSDTVKLVNSRGFVEKTVDRKRVFLATTPQIFEKKLYLSAKSTAKTAELLTDDNQLLEQMPYPIKVVDCGRENMKITEPRDVALAEFILRKRGRDT